MKTFFSVAVLFVVLTTSARAQLNSGPDAGASVAPLRIAVVTGNDAGAELDVVKQRDGMPTIYIFIQADKWDRPVARFLHTLDDELRKDRPDVAVIATWLTDNVETTKDYL